MEDNYKVQIINKKTGEVVEDMGPMNFNKAQKVQRGASINLNHKSFKVELKEVKKVIACPKDPDGQHFVGCGCDDQEAQQL